MKLFKNPQQYFQVIETGKLETMFEGDVSQLMLIKRENERMIDGMKVLALPLDQHRMHIMEHQAISADPDLRENVELMRLLNDHIQEHIDMLRTADPDLLALIGEQPLQPMAPPPGAPGQPPVGSMQKADVSEMMQQQRSQVQPGEEVNGEVMPSIPSPPAPFDNLPTNPEDL